MLNTILPKLASNFLFSVVFDCNFLSSECDQYVCVSISFMSIFPKLSLQGDRIVQ